MPVIFNQRRNRAQRRPLSYNISFLSGGEMDGSHTSWSHGAIQAAKYWTHRRGSKGEKIVGCLILTAAHTFTPRLLPPEFNPLGCSAALFVYIRWSHIRARAGMGVHEQRRKPECAYSTSAVIREQGRPCDVRPETCQD